MNVLEQFFSFQGINYDLARNGCEDELFKISLFLLLNARDIKEIAESYDKCDISDFDLIDSFNSFEIRIGKRAKNLS